MWINWYEKIGFSEKRNRYNFSKKKKMDFITLASIQRSFVLCDLPVLNICPIFFESPCTKVETNVI